MSSCTGKIGIALNINWCEPETNSTQDVAACERYQQFNVSKPYEDKRQCALKFILGRVRSTTLPTETQKLIPFLGSFTKLRKVTTSFVMSVRPSVGTEQLGSHSTDFHEISYLMIFRKSVEKIQVSLKSDMNNGYFI
jgi:hypothetical protein